MATERTRSGSTAREVRPPELDDLTLRRAANGDAWALETFVRRYERMVLRATTRVLGPGNPSIQDVAQETFLKAIPALKAFDAAGPARLSTWLTTIAMRSAIDELRRSRRLEHAAEDDTIELESATPDVVLDDQRRKVALSAAMERLHGEQRAILLLAVEEEMSMQQIATALGIEVGTAKSRLSRARSALAQAVLGPPSRGHHD